MKKRMPYILIILLLAFSMLCQGCADDSGGVSSDPEQTGTGSGEVIEAGPADETGAVTFSRDLGSIPQDVFFIITNSESTDATTCSISVSAQSIAEKQRNFKSDSDGINEDLTEWARAHGVGLRGKPEITAFNSDLSMLEPARSDAVVSGYPQEPRLVIAGQTQNTFYYTSVSDTVTATARSVTTDGFVTLNIWVADDAWGNCAKHYCMTQDMVDAYASRFLQAGAGNDIYDWVGNIYGAPWGSHEYTNLIPESSKDTIDILFFDIDDDGNSATDPDPTGGVLGLFWSKDNYLTTTWSYSNERLLFYIDSVLAAKPFDSSWEITDYWPSEMVSTLAHEFQHMIHFYQKNVTFNVSSETWINEMASLVTEDLLSKKLSVNGPRGVPYNDDSAGSAGNSSGRLPLFDYMDYHSPTVWYSGTSSLVSYAMNYSFGAYLARNYGGAGLFRRIVQSGKTDDTAITDAVAAMGYTGETFTTLLQKWGAAVLLSDLTNPSNGYRYNTGSSFASTLDGISYELGSINLFNYSYNYVTGPYLFTLSSLSNLSRHLKFSNTYLQVGEAETGNFSATINMTDGLELTIVLKDSN